MDPFGLQSSAAHEVVQLGMPKMPHATDSARWSDGKFRPGEGNPGSGVIGDDAVQLAAEHLSGQGYEIVGQQVRMTNGSRTTVTDILARDPNRDLLAVEVKSNSARQTPAQMEVYESLNQGSGDVHLTGTVAGELFDKTTHVSQPGLGLRYSENTGSFSSFNLGK